MKLSRFLIIIFSIFLTACSRDISEVSVEQKFDSEKTISTELKIDSDVGIENADEEVALLSGKENIKNDHPSKEEFKINTTEDMTVFTPEDIAFIENIENRDWEFKEESTWILRFNDGMLIIGQKNGQITDVLKYQVTSINHEEESMVIHVVKRVNEHAQVEEKSVRMNYYSEIIIAGDTLTYKNKINDSDQFTETIWTRSALKQ